MDISEELGSKNFINTFHKAMVNLLFTSKWYDSQINEIFTAHGLQGQHFNVLKILKGKHPQSCNPKEIKEVMIDKGRDLTRLLDKLDAMKLVTRKLNNKNRRQIDIKITSQGLQLAEALDQQLFKKIEEIKNITEKEAEQLTKLLDKVRG